MRRASAQLLEARERAYATNSKVVSKRIFDRKPKLQKGILPSSIPACQRDEVRRRARGRSQRPRRRARAGDDAMATTRPTAM